MDTFKIAKLFLNDNKCFWMRKENHHRLFFVAGTNGKLYYLEADERKVDKTTLKNCTEDEYEKMNQGYEFIDFLTNNEKICLQTSY